MASPRHVQLILENNLGEVPAGNRLVMPVEIADFQAALKRVKNKNIVKDGMRRGSPPEKFDLSGSISAAYMAAHPAATILRQMSYQQFPLPARDVDAAITAVAAGNKLVKADGWAATNLAKGDVLWVSGMPANGGGFVILVDSVAGNDMAINTNVKVLADEDTGANVRIHRLRQFKLGSPRLLQTVTVEEWNDQTGKGYQWPGVGISKYVVNFPESGAVTESFTHALLAASTPLAALPASDPEVDFEELVAGFDLLDKLNANSGLGFSYNGAALSDAIFQKMTLDLDNPVVGRMGIGSQGVPQDLDIQSDVDFKFDLTVAKGTVDAYDIESRARDIATEDFISFGFRDRLDVGGIWVMPKLEPFDQKKGPVKADGDQEFSLAFQAAYSDLIDSYVTYAEFDTTLLPA